MRPWVVVVLGGFLALWGGCASLPEAEAPLVDVPSVVELSLDGGRTWVTDDVVVVSHPERIETLVLRLDVENPGRIRVTINGRPAGSIQFLRKQAGRTLCTLDLRLFGGRYRLVAGENVVDVRIAGGAERPGVRRRWLVVSHPPRGDSRHSAGLATRIPGRA